MGADAFVSVLWIPDVQVHVGAMAEDRRISIAMTNRFTICQPDKTIGILLRQGSLKLFVEQGLELLGLWQQR